MITQLRTAHRGELNISPFKLIETLTIKQLFKKQISQNRFMKGMY